jgi:hypothetical protein
VKLLLSTSKCELPAAAWAPGYEFKGIDFTQSRRGAEEEIGRIESRAMVRGYSHQRLLAFRRSKAAASNIAGCALMECGASA